MRARTNGRESGANPRARDFHRVGARAEWSARSNAARVFRPMQLIPLPRDGLAPDFAGARPTEAREVAAVLVRGYDSGFVPPWIGYLASDAGVPVGLCAFKGPPRDGAVEIAYFTFPAHEGRGVATRMARELIALARATDPAIRVRAQTLPSENASTRILRKLGFGHARDVAHPEDGLVWEWELPL